MSEDSKSGEGCKTIAIKLCCEKDALVIRIEGAEGQQLVKACCGEAAKGAGEAKREGCC